MLGLLLHDLSSFFFALNRACIGFDSGGKVRGKDNIPSDHQSPVHPKGFSLYHHIGEVGSGW